MPEPFTWPVACGFSVEFQYINLKLFWKRGEMNSNDLWLKTLYGLLQCGHKLGFKKIATNISLGNNVGTAQAWFVLSSIHEKTLGQ